MSYKVAVSLLFVHFLHRIENGIAFNIDVNSTDVFRGDVGSWFGYSVAMSSGIDTDRTTQRRLLVGSPKSTVPGKGRIGSIFQCRRKERRCSRMREFDDLVRDANAKVDDQLLGATLTAQSNTDQILACAPMYKRRKQDNLDAFYPCGRCILNNDGGTTQISVPGSGTTGDLELSRSNFAIGLMGFSAFFSDTDLLIGAPGFSRAQGTLMRVNEDRETDLAVPIEDDQVFTLYTGYATTSGDFDVATSKETLIMLDTLIEKLTTAKKFDMVDMERTQIDEVIDNAKRILLEKPMLLEIKAPTRVLGDIHGQYYDLLHVFGVIGYPEKNNQMLFLGDYVDRGKWGIETIVLLLALKVKYPQYIHLLRGNHETQNVSRVYGFYTECKNRYDVALWKHFCEAFECMPVAACINKSILCMHGGLSPELNSLDDIRNLKQPVDVPPSGLITDLLWSDPDKNREQGWKASPRGVSFTFAKDVVDETCKRLELDLIMRAHQVVYYGYELFADGKLITIFTAPNFCGQFENNGAIVNVDKVLKVTLIIIDGRQQKT